MTKQPQDKNFDSNVAKLQRNIYGSGKGKIREAVLWRDLQNTIDTNGKPLKILDVGGGQGRLALRLAEAGHDVTLNDISSEMLAAAKVDAKEQDLLDKMKFVHCPLQELPHKLANQEYDLVMCHAVFEWLAEPALAVPVLSSLLKQEGQLSLMFYNFDALQLSTILYGNFEFVENNYKVRNTVALNPQNPQKISDVQNWLAASGLNVFDKTGVRCFYDYMRDREMWVTKFDDILKQELRLGKDEPYASIARYIHLQCRF